MMTVQELKALIANLPDDAVVEVGESGGDYSDYLTVSFPQPDGRDEVIDLEEFKPGETYGQYKARKEEEGRKGREFAAFLDGLLHEKPGNT